MHSDSENNETNTPPDIVEAAKVTCITCFRKKSRIKYEVADIKKKKFVIK